VAIVLILLAAVFAVAGLTKLVDRAGFRESLREFGVPGRLVAPVGMAVPVVEVVVAVALLLPGTGWWAAVVATGLLVGFTAVVARTLARGRRPDCNCFGRLSRGPVGRDTIVRNGVLAALGVLVIVAGPGPGALSWLIDLAAWQRAALAAATLLAVVVAFEGWLLVNLTRQNGRLLDRVGALEAALHGHHRHAPAVRVGDPAPAVRVGDATPAVRFGDPAPAVRLRDLDGDEVDVRWTGPTVVLFWSPDCGFCQQMLPGLRAWEAARPADGPALVVISAGSIEDNRALALTSPVLLDDVFAVGHAFGASGTPQAVLVDAGGAIASPLATGADAVRDLLGARPQVSSGTSPVREM
jgi:uncharacterized membrane protein YphA (DoxX/SURF4 family)/thiol-disulfide isomerase/thioredoxin